MNDYSLYCLKWAKVWWTLGGAAVLIVFFSFVSFVIEIIQNRQHSEMSSRNFEMKMKSSPPPDQDPLNPTSPVNKWEKHQFSLLKLLMVLLSYFQYDFRGKNKSRYSLVFVEDFETRRTAVCLQFIVLSLYKVYCLTVYILHLLHLSYE